MSSKPETTFYRAVHKFLPKELYREKMANPYRGGTPDVWYSGTLDDLWVEYKYIKKPPKRAEICVWKELSPLQLQWLEGRCAEGRNVAVILGTPVGAWIYERRSWETEGITLENLLRSGKSRQEVADYIRGRTMISCD